MPTKNQRSGDPGRDLMEKFIEFLQRKLDRSLLDPQEDGYAELTTGELNVIEKLLSNNSITFSSVKRGDFGEHAQALAEEFPFPEDENVYALKR